MVVHTQLIREIWGYILRAFTLKQIPLTSENPFNFYDRISVTEIRIWHSGQI